MWLSGYLRLAHPLKFPLLLPAPLSSVTEPLGNISGAAAGSYTTAYGYDEINELTSVTDANGDHTSYGYDNVGNKTTVTDPLSNITRQDYNLSHRPTVATDAAGKTTSQAYDLDGLVKATTGQNGNAAQYTLDPRGDVIQAMVPHDTSGGTTTYNTTQYIYDQAGNRTQVLTPRALANGTSRSSSCTSTQTCPFTYVTQYDADNRVSAQRSAYNPADSTYNTPAVTSYTYNQAGRLKKVTAPASGMPASGGPNVTTYVYFDNDWVRSSADPWNITTSYDYNDNGQQKSRTITSADGSAATPGSGSMSRTMSWSYCPGGQLQSVNDDGVPDGLYSEVVDNSDVNNASSSGAWTTSTSVSGFTGYNYATHAAGAGSDTFTWNLRIPKDGNYTVYVAYPAVSGAATSASFKVSYHGGTATVPVNQTTNASTAGSPSWVSLGKYAFTQADTGQKVTLTQSAAGGGTVVADAVRVVRDTTGGSNTAHHDFTYSYDPNGNQKGIADSSATGPAVASYAMTYDGINRLTNVEEDNSAGSAVHTTIYGYDAGSNLTSRGHDSATSDYTYDPRNLLATETDKSWATDPSPQVTTFDYTPDGLRKTEDKPNGNTVTYSYFADGLLAHQLETTSGSATVAEHTYAYNPDGIKASDAQKLMNADTGTLMSHSLAYSYDPRDRLTRVQTDGTATESYVHDAARNRVKGKRSPAIAAAWSGPAGEARTEACASATAPARGPHDLRRASRSASAGPATVYRRVDVAGLRSAVPVLLLPGDGVAAQLAQLESDVLGRAEPAVALVVAFAGVALVDRPAVDLDQAGVVGLDDDGHHEALLLGRGPDVGVLADAADARGHWSSFCLPPGRKRPGAPRRYGPVPP